MEEEIRILKEAINLLKEKYIPHKYLAMEAIRDICPRDDYNFTLKAVIKVLPDNIVSLSHRNDLQGNINIIKSVLKMIDW